MKRLAAFVAALLLAAVPAPARAQQWGRPQGPGSGSPIYQPVYPEQPPAAAGVPAELVAASVKINRPALPGEMTARVWTTRQGEQVWVGGSGTVVRVDGSTAYVLTNRHVCPPGCGEIRVTTADGRVWPAEYVASAACGADLSLIAASAGFYPPATAARVADRQPARGEAVWQVGYGATEREGQRLRRRSGRALGFFDRTEAGCWNLKLDLPSLHGDSGSGIFRQSDGALVAVLWGGDSRVTVAVGLQDVRPFLAECWRRRPKQPAPRQPGFPPDVPQQPPAQQPPAGDQAPVLAQIADLQAKIAALQSQVAGMKPQPGPAGPPGKDGAPGPQGPQGPPGASADTTKLAAAVAALQQQITALQQQLQAQPGPISVTVEPHQPTTP